MAKFRMKLKLEKLEVELEGDRASAPEMAAGFRDQIAGLLEQPIRAMVIQNDQPTEPVQRPLPAEPTSAGTTRNRKAKSSGGSRKTAEPIDFKHDPTQYGMPTQDWSTAQKAMFTLFSCGAQAGAKELSAHTIAATFNKHFKQFRAIRPQNVSRDLGLVKGKSVNEDTTADPPVWLLLETGEAEVRALIEKGRPASPAS